MFDHEKYVTQIPTKEFINPQVFSIPAVDELEARYPELKEWLIYSLTYEINVDQIIISFFQNCDVVILVHGVYWYIIYIHKKEELMLSPLKTVLKHIY